MYKAVIRENKSILNAILNTVLPKMNSIIEAIFKHSNQ